MKGTIRTRELKHGEVASPFDDILANINWGIKAGIKKANKKPLDSLLDSVNDVYVKTDTYFAKLKKENETLDEDREKLWKHNAEQQVKIDELVKENEEVKQDNFELKDEIVMLKELLTPEQEWIFKRQMEDKKKENE